MARIQYVKGDLFESKAQVIVNTVNCQGVMGKGLALEFKQRYPDMFEVYQKDCKSGKLRIGRPTLYKKSSPWILNFPTKNYWRLPSKLEYLEKGLEFLVAHYQKVGITSIAFPKLGAQNGKLSWDEVGPLMAKYLSQLDIDVYIYIAESDKEYQYDTSGDSKVQEQIWEAFNELATSTDRLCEEVGLSQREAAKVAKRRGTTVFKSLADIEGIETLAAISIKRIKAYISHKKLITAALPGLTDAAHPHQPPSKASAKPTRRKGKKKSKETVELVEKLQLPEIELVG